jgi:hypothetical protein
MKTGRPFVLVAKDAPKAWGWELWLTATRPPAEAVDMATGQSLADIIAAHPEMLGYWTRPLFGDSMPIFAKLIHTHFPRRVHMGFRRPVEREELLGWLDREQTLLRELFGALRVPDKRAFDSYEERYSAWAAEQALAGWRRDNDVATATALAAFVDSSKDVQGWLREVRDNRAKIVDVLNDVDLDAESGNLLLMGAGTVHAIFGLSHQTHPKDRSRARLEALFGTLAERATAGGSDAELAGIIDSASLPELRAGNAAPPKNEAWLPLSVLGQPVLAEPQQTSDTTYSLADFYTPLVWTDGKACFRKGDAAHGLSREQLSGYLEDVDFTVTPVAAMRRSPTEASAASSPGATLLRLVDEPSAWPFFTAYQLELTGRFTASPPSGVFQQLIVTRGRVELSDRGGVVGELSPRAPGFVPASVAEPYTLVALEPATVLIFAVPGARGGAPVVSEGALKARTTAAGG